MFVEDVLARVEFVGDDATGNVLVPVGGDPSFPEVVRRSSRRTARHVVGAGVVTGVGVEPVGAVEPDHAGTSPAISSVAEGTASDATVFCRHQGVSTIILDD